MNQISDQNRLKKNLEKESGIVVNSIARCRTLSTWLERKQIFISYSTLSRFYQLTSKNYKTHTSTLDLLSNAIGSLSFDHFCNKANNQTLGAILLKKAQMHLSLLHHQMDSMEAVRFFLKKQQENPVIYAELSNQLSKQLFTENKKNIPAIQLLATTELGRKYFFQYFVDEDDISGMYESALSRYFTHRNSTDQENLFARLFIYRKKLLRNPAIKNEVRSFLDEIKSTAALKENMHFLSRWYELDWITEYLRNKKSNPEMLFEKTQEILSAISTNNNGNEVIACLGRWNRALMFTGAADSASIPDSWLKICSQELMQGYRDLEFQSSIYGLFSKRKELVIPKNEVPFNQWDNALFTSSLFLQSEDYLHANRSFYEQKLKIHPMFLQHIIR